MMGPIQEKIEKPCVVKMSGIVKRFPGVLANDHIDFELCQGEIHALLGENGAGKSTLMNILNGLYRQDSGTIKISGQQVQFSSPRDAIANGIGMVHQHFMLVPSMSVTENILIGLDKPRFLLNLPKYEDKISAMGQKFGLKVDPNAKVWQLSVGEQQRVEILKMLYRGAEILILDEPTAVLAPSEIVDFFATLRAMAKEGKSIIFITHKLNEVLEIADRATVLRKGKVSSVGIPIKNTTRVDLARMMVGRDIVFNVEKKTTQPGEVVLKVEGITAKNDKGLLALKGISIDVKANEIVGLAGVAGNGQSELAEVIAGLRPAESGKILVNNEDIANCPVRKGIKIGVSLIPEDRTRVGTAPNLSITENMIMKNYDHEPISNGWVINATAADKFAGELRKLYDISVPSTKTSVRLLSGGNLQKVILAREIASQPTLMVAVQPTRGLDVGAIEGIQRLIIEQRSAGAAILLISEELEELLSLSDRVYVIYEGEIMGEVKDGDIETIGLMMTGSRREKENEGKVNA